MNILLKIVSKLWIGTKLVLIGKVGAVANSLTFTVWVILFNE